MKTKSTYPRSKVVLTTLSIMMLTSINHSQIFSNTVNTYKAVYYKGEWIASVDLPEVNIKANRINKGGKKPYLKTIETAYENGEKIMHITYDEVNISAVKKEVSSNDLFIEDHNVVEAATSINGLSKNTTQRSNSNTSIANADIKNSNENNKINYKWVTKEIASQNKKPLLTRMINKLYTCGYYLIQKVNDGLYFRS